ncbi:histidine phosphatase superfamily [Annulohypoxylon bovei var. microspora]|nr:histidine phosphatase superfamily [Annulohypoxylon bovei var. microspora]
MSLFALNKSASYDFGGPPRKLIYGNQPRPNSSSNPIVLSDDSGNSGSTLPPTTIHIFRHAEGLHNVDARGGLISDPYLTTVGLAQCALIQRSFTSDIDIVIASPMKRAIQTAIFCFAPVLKSGTKRILLVPELQEAGSEACNVGSPPNDLVKEFGNVIDASRLGKIWHRDGGGDSSLALASRSIVARKAIKDIISNYKTTAPNQKNINVVVVSHGRFIPYLTQDFVGPTAQMTSLLQMWPNTGYRSYQFSSETDLHETDASMRGRLVHGSMANLQKQGQALHVDFQTRRRQVQTSNNASIFDF